MNSGRVGFTQRSLRFIELKRYDTFTVVYYTQKDGMTLTILFLWHILRFIYNASFLVAYRDLEE
jgi:hypothetical protein